MKYYEARNQMHIRYKIKDILKAHWHSFVELMASQNKPIRQVIMDEVEKVIDCQEPKKGHTLYFCTNCNTIKSLSVNNQEQSNCTKSCGMAINYITSTCLKAINAQASCRSPMYEKSYFSNRTNIFRKRFNQEKTLSTTHRLAV